MSEIETVTPEAINVILTVEQRQDGQYYVRYDGMEFDLATDLRIHQEHRPEWGKPLIHFGFAGFPK